MIRLKNIFILKQKCPAVFFGNRCRIDAVITPKDYTDWANKSLSFGVEFKHFSDGTHDPGDKHASLNYYSKQFKQIIDYSYTEFNGFGRIPILICPPLFGNISGKEYTSSLQLIKNCMGQCNIGELSICPRNGLSIYFNTFHRIWSERWGVSVGKVQKFLIKTGSGSPI